MAFTVLNCGTQFHRDSQNELIADFGRAMAGQEYVDYLINDGPGSVREKGKTPGEFDPFTRDKTLKSQSPKWSRTKTETLDNFVTGEDVAEHLRQMTAERKEQLHLKPYDVLTKKQMKPLVKGEKKYLDSLAKPKVFTPTGPAGTGLAAKVAGKGSVYGDGWDDNIRHTISTLAQRFLPSHTEVVKPEGKRVVTPEGIASGTVNMIGWSRGAVTCLRIANWAREFLGNNVTFNIFAVDPVAGLNAGEKLWDTCNVPSTVKNLVVVLAMDDMGANFLPQDLQRMTIVDPGNTRALFLPVPGKHSTPVMNEANLTEVTQVVRYLAYKFLISFPARDGTRFAPDKIPTASLNVRQLMELYAQMQLKRGDYKSLWQKSLSTGKRTERTVNTQLNAYMSADSRFFVNEHHRACLRTAFPAVDRYFFTAQGRRDEVQHKTELDSLKKNCPETLKLLESVYGVSYGREDYSTPYGKASRVTWRLPDPGCGRAAQNVVAPNASALAGELIA